jgi:hypothetical protein
MSSAAIIAALGGLQFAVSCSHKLIYFFFTNHHDGVSLLWGGAVLV